MLKASYHQAKKKIDTILIKEGPVVFCHYEISFAFPQLLG